MPESFDFTDEDGDRVRVEWDDGLDSFVIEMGHVDGSLDQCVALPPEQARALADWLIGKRGNSTA